MTGSGSNVGSPVICAFVCTFALPSCLLSLVTTLRLSVFHVWEPSSPLGKTQVRNRGNGRQDDGPVRKGGPSGNSTGHPEKLRGAFQT